LTQDRIHLEVEISNAGFISILEEEKMPYKEAMNIVMICEGRRNDRVEKLAIAAAKRKNR
jgi:hypothetical protein